MTPLTDLDEANAQLAALREELDARLKEIEDLRAQLEQMQRHIYGRRREKVDPGQLRLFEENVARLEELLRSMPEPPPPPATREKKGHGRPPFSPDLPRDTIARDVPEAERCCPDCGETMRHIGREVTERGHTVPARIVVRRYVREKYACPHGHAVKTAELPEGVVDRGKYEASVYAFVATAKYADHVPLNRLQNIFKRQGAHLPRQTAWDLTARLDELVAQPVWKEMHRQMLEEPALQADETPMVVQVEGQRGTRKGTIWAWRNVRGSPVEKVLVDFRCDRSSRGPDAFLGNWSGTLLTDGYDGVNPSAVRNDIERAGCWAHARRKFRDALTSAKKKAAAPFRLIDRLFWIERAITARAKRAELDFDGLKALRLEVRARRSTRVLRDIFDVAFALDEDPSVTKGSMLQKAVTYVINQRAPLLAHLRHGNIPIHNNDTERDLRHVVVGRKNYLIFGSQRGGEVAGRLYSLAMSCKLVGVDPAAYLEDVLSRISTTPASQIASLTPWAWAAAQRASSAPTTTS